MWVFFHYGEADSYELDVFYFFFAIATALELARCPTMFTFYPEKKIMCIYGRCLPGYSTSLHLNILL